MIDSLKYFLDFFKEYYSHEYNKLPQSFKDECIEEILLNNHKYITCEMVQSVDYCIRCGRCCIKQRCPHVDRKTHLCEIHDNPIDDLCKTYPWTGEDLGIAPLDISCTYQKAFFISFLDEFFSKCEMGDYHEK